MTESPQKRRYRSPQRQAQAQATRERILTAARHLFATQGYVAATLPAIAQEAGVAAPTVTAVFGTKVALVEALVAQGVRGDEEPGPLSERPWWQEMLREPDPRQQLARHAANIEQIHARTTDLFEIVRTAAVAAPEIAVLWQSLRAGHLEDDRQVAESLSQKGALRGDVTVAQAADLLWALGSAELYRMLVVERRWAPRHYQEWLTSAWVHGLLDIQSEP